MQGLPGILGVVDLPGLSGALRILAMPSGMVVDRVATGGEAGRANGTMGAMDIRTTQGARGTPQGTRGATQVSRGTT